MNKRICLGNQRKPSWQWDNDQRQIDRWVNEGGALCLEEEDHRSKRNGRMASVRDFESRFTAARQPAAGENLIRLEIHGDDRSGSADSFRAFAERRVNAALRRFRGRVNQVMLTLTDVNGVRGGNDKRVRMIVRLHPRGRVINTTTDANAFVAVARAADRTGHSVRRKFRRRRTSRISNARRRAAGTALTFY